MASRRPKPVTLDPSNIEGAVKAPATATVAPQLATLAEAAPDGAGWLHEIKFDGYRMIAHVSDGSTSFASRNGLDWTRRLPELGVLMAQLPVKEAIIDGELCHVLPSGATSFSALKTDLGDKHTDGLVFFAFDLLYLNGYRLHEATLLARKTLLEYILISPPDHRIRYSVHQVGNGPEFFAAAAAMHLEGTVSKLAIGKYRSGRGSNWLKVKALGREELVVVGYTDPENSRVGFGALLVGYYNPAGTLTYAGKVGTGYSDKLLLRLRRQLNAIENLAPTVTLPKGITTQVCIGSGLRLLSRRALPNGPQAEF